MQLRFAVLRKELKKDDHKELVKATDAFGKETTLKIMFKKVLKNYLGMKNGINVILLEYNIHHNNVPGQVGIEYAAEYEDLVVTTLFERIALEAEIGNVWLVLEDLTLRGPAHAYIIHLDRA